MVEIIKGTFGYFDGKKIKPITQNDGPQTFDPELEERLVSRDKIARYVTNETAENPEQPKENLDELPEYNRDMKLAELKKIAKLYGVDASSCTSKAEVCDLIDETRAEEGGEDDQPDLSPASPV